MMIQTDYDDIAKEKTMSIGLKQQLENEDKLPFFIGLITDFNGDDIEQSRSFVTILRVV